MAAGMGARTANCAEGLWVPDPKWRSEVERMLALILTRVAGVEDAVGNLASGIATTVGEKGRNVVNEANVQGYSSTVPLQDERVDVATSNAHAGRQCASHSNQGDTVEDCTTPLGAEIQQNPQPVQHPRTETNMEILVNLDTESDQSRDIAAVECRKRTPESHAKRVHSQPRQRVVPCNRQLLGVPATTPNEDPTHVATPNPIQRAPRYKDPPGYDATDFGVSAEPSNEPPLLQPRKNGVSRHPHFPIFCR